MDATKPFTVPKRLVMDALAPRDGGGVCLMGAV